MTKLFVGIIGCDTGKVEFSVFPHKEKEAVQSYCREYELRLIDLIEVEFSVGAGDTAPTVLGALASTPDGVEALHNLLHAAVSGYRRWQPPLVLSK